MSNERAHYYAITIVIIALERRNQGKWACAADAARSKGRREALAHRARRAERGTDAAAAAPRQRGPTAHPANPHQGQSGRSPRASRWCLRAEATRRSAPRRVVGSVQSAGPAESPQGGIRVSGVAVACLRRAWVEEARSPVQWHGGVPPGCHGSGIGAQARTLSCMMTRRRITKRHE